MTYEYAGVYILDIPFHADRMYDYYIPAELNGKVIPGTIVSVPYGNGNRKMSAVTIEIKPETECENPKPVFSVLSTDALVDAEMIKLCFFMKKHTLCTVGDALRSMIPSAALSQSSVYYVPEYASDVSPNQLSVKATFVYNFICAHGKVPLARLKNEYGQETEELIASLIKLKLIKKVNEFKAASGNKYITFAELSVSPKEAEDIADSAPGALLRLRSSTHAEILKYLAANGKSPSDKIFAECGANSGQLAALEKKELIKLTKEIDIRNPYTVGISSDGTRDTKSELSDEQLNAYDKLSELFLAPDPKAALLHGVTGSGKTKVIMAMIDLAIAEHRGVIVLVPEISLTPQMVSVFCGSYGDRVAVIHSSLSAGERHDAWYRVKNGDADIVIGTRSAVFAPVHDLGMIVIDEEQEHTYKSDTTPKYSAHDIARFRCAEHNALLLLSSATPSVTSYYKAKTGTYALIELNNRYGEAKLPDVIITDMRKELSSGNDSPLSAVLKEKVAENTLSGNQSIIFLNRRGYNNFVSCRSCGETIKCPNCSVALTYHTKRFIGAGNSDNEDYLKKRINGGIMKCHYCGYTLKVPEKCPSCDSAHFMFMGYGTQRAEEEIASISDTIRVIRMDNDTTQGKFSHDAILSAFRKGDADVLLGTQMVTKGHDFPNVTLVGVLNADSSLYLEDYRASERTFSMLTQVIGRAGRADKPGMAIIQTMNPGNDVITLAAAQDYKTFYEREIRIRKALLFPPFCDIVLITLTSQDEALLSRASVRISERLRDLLKGSFADVPLIIFGPFEAPIYKIQGACRMRLVIKCKLTKRTLELISEILYEFGKNSGKRLTVSADLNPNSI